MMQIVTNLSLLREPCRIVEHDEGESVGNILVEELRKNSSAVGLAANQVGINARVCAIKHSSGILYFVNPEIIEKENPILFKDEGCLSMPGKRINTIRFERVVVKDLNDVREFKNFSAVAIQHEIDHTFGKLMKDANIYEECPCGSGKKFKFCHMR